MDEDNDPTGAYIDEAEEEAHAADAVESLSSEWFDAYVERGVEQTAAEREGEPEAGLTPEVESMPADEFDRLIRRSRGEDVTLSDAEIEAQAAEAKRQRDLAELREFSAIVREGLEKEKAAHARLLADESVESDPRPDLPQFDPSVLPATDFHALLDAVKEGRQFEPQVPADPFAVKSQVERVYADREAWEKTPFWERPESGA